jgi:cyclophilin family peptidyl-prolyl cis-trans isomerase
VPSQKRIQQRRNRTMKELRMQQMARRRRQRIFLGGTGAAIAIVVVVVLATTLTGGGKKNAASTTTAHQTSTTKSATTTSTTSPPVSVPLLAAPAKVGCPALNGTSKHYTRFTAPPPMCIDPAKAYTATIATTAGDITVRFLAAQNPITVNNFVFLSLYHFYNGTAFHRVCTGFVDQGGDPTGTGSGGPGYSFDGGAPKSASVYTAGALAMANSGSPKSDGSQFFFVVDDGGKQLSPNYSYFGQVANAASLAVLNKINAGGTSAAATGGTCPPKVVYRIEDITIHEAA